MGDVPKRDQTLESQFPHVTKAKLKMSSNCRTFIKGMMDNNPTKRLGSKNGSTQILKHPWFKNFEVEKL
jgi:serine/threonine protein kinase